MMSCRRGKRLPELQSIAYIYILYKLTWPGQLQVTLTRQNLPHDAPPLFFNPNSLPFMILTIASALNKIGLTF